MKKSQVIKAAIVDDEPLARQRIRLLLGNIERIEVVAECENGQEAINCILRIQPDVVFLDIEMPDMSGFDVIRAMGVEKRPIVVFVTAYDEYAVKAFEVHAVDYLLKPFDRNRFREAVDRVISDIDEGVSSEMSERLDRVLSTLRSDSVSDRIIVKSNGRLKVILINQIDWIESAGNYVKLHIGRESQLHRSTMRAMESRLEEFGFVRTHRTVIVNIERVKEMAPLYHGDFLIILKNGQQLPLSRRYRDRFDSVLDKI